MGEQPGKRMMFPIPNKEASKQDLMNSLLKAMKEKEEEKLEKRKKKIADE